MSTARKFSALLLDIEGTTTPISFVTDVLFPYAERSYEPFITTHWSDPDFQPYKSSFTSEEPSLTSSPSTLVSFVRAKHAANEKHTAFKALQGAIWQSGYTSGELKSLIYNDVVPCITSLKREGVEVFIYSSGSVPAQKLLFRYSNQGDITPLLSGYFDTQTAGPKIETASYTKISRTIGRSAGEVLFLSDNVKEVKAAQEAGMQSYIVERPGNAALSNEDRERHRVITSFEQI